MATLGNCRGGRGPRPHALRAGPATPAATAPARPRPPGTAPAEAASLAREASPRPPPLTPHQEKGEEAAAGADLVFLGRASEGSRVSLVSLLAAPSRPSPAPRLPTHSGARPVPRRQPSAPLRVTADWLGEPGRGPQQSREGGPRRRPRAN